METVENGNITWTVADCSGVSTATQRLQTEQPQTLVVDIPDDVPTRSTLNQFCQVVQKKFTGNFSLKLWRSYLKYEKCDRSMMVFPTFK